MNESTSMYHHRKNDHPLPPRLAEAGQHPAPTWSLKALGFLLVVIFTGLRLWQLSSYDLWGGETFGLVGIELGWQQGLRYFANDIVHPPFYYLLLAGWIKLGGGTAPYLKGLSVLAAVFTLIPLLLLGRNLNIRPAAMALTLFLTGANGFLIHYAQEVRSYTLFLFTAILSLWAFVRIVNEGRPTRADWTWLLMSNLLLVFTHYYGWLVVGIELFTLLWLDRSRLSTFVKHLFFLIIAYIPWLLLLIQPLVARRGLGPNLDWVPQPTIASLLTLFMTFNGYVVPDNRLNAIGLLIFGAPILIWALSIVRDRGLLKRRENVLICWLGGVTFLPVLFIFFCSWVFPQALFIDRYFIFVTIPYYLLIGVTAWQIRPVPLRLMIIVAICVWTIAASLHDLSANRTAWVSPQVGSRVPWLTITNSMIERTSAEGEILVYVIPSQNGPFLTGDWAITTSLEYHLSALDEERFHFIYTPSFEQFAPSQNEPEFWVVYFHLDPTISKSMAPNFIEEKGFAVDDVLSFANGEQELRLLKIIRP